MSWGGNQGNPYGQGGFNQGFNSNQPQGGFNQGFNTNPIPGNYGTNQGFSNQGGYGGNQGFNVPQNQGGYGGQGFNNNTPGFNQGYNQGYNQPFNQGFNQGFNNSVFPNFPNIPPIQFNPTCKKCHGTGQSACRRGGVKPCARCYRRAGYCKKCYGTGFNYRRQKACKKCAKGKMMSNKSSSSSDSD